MEHGNLRTVYVVQVDNNKDMSDAKQYGKLQAVFGNPRKPYDTANMVSKARKVLENWNSGDYLLMIGDPTLCAVSMALVAEQNDVVNILSWDRNTFQYMPQRWDFNLMHDDFVTADD
jgi:hypothetical protein